MRKTIIISLSALITIITVILALNTSSKLSDLTVNILIGIYTSSIVVLILEIITFLKNSNRYGFLNKKYKRINNRTSKNIFSKPRRRRTNRGRK